MDSPLKKRKLASQESGVSKVTSTPQKELSLLQDISPSLSRIQISSNNTSRKQLIFPHEQTNGEISDLPEVEESSNSVATDLEDVDEELLDDELLDYDEFFSKHKKLSKKGTAWNLYKPIGEDGGALYHQIIENPKQAGDIGKWFVNYCSTITEETATFIIFKLCLDCAGYQKYNLEKHFRNSNRPISELVESIMNKVDDGQCKAEIYTTGRFLFADNSKVARILQMGIYNFLQKFVIKAHKEGLLYQTVFLNLLKLIEAMFTATHRHLVYTGAVFMMKLLTPICMLKFTISDSNISAEHNDFLDNFINLLYLKSVKVCRSKDKRCASLKTTYLIELKIWIFYSAKIFIDHYSCLNPLKNLLLEPDKSVRMAALNTVQKLIQDENLIVYLNAGHVGNLVDHIAQRFYDTDIKVALKAFEVYSALIPYYFKEITKRKEVFNTIVKLIYTEDYRIGSAAGRLVVQILNKEDSNEREMLLNIGRIGMTEIGANLCPLLVESLLEHTIVLQNWNLHMQIFTDASRKDVPIPLRLTLSNIFLESVYQILTGVSSKPRMFSPGAKELDPNKNKLLADLVYLNLKAIFVLYYREHPGIVKTILEIAVKIDPEYLSENHIESIGDILKYFIKFFMFWSDCDVLIALLDFLLFINTNVAVLNKLSTDTIESVEKYISEKLYKSIQNKDDDDNTTLVVKKTALVFSKFDLNNSIEWTKILASWDIIQSTEFLEAAMTCCHWSIFWRIKELNTMRLSKAEQSEKMSLIDNITRVFFFNSLEMLSHEDKDLRFKAFEKVCEAYITFCKELNISKQNRSMEVLKSSFHKEMQEKILDVFKSRVVKCEASVAHKYSMYIVNMAYLSIIPMESMSFIFQHYDNQYETYGALVESVFATISEKNPNWVSPLVLNTLCICLESLLKRGPVDIKTQEAKDVLSLAIRFSECKAIRNEKTASRILMYGINYTVKTKRYDLLIFVTVFSNELKDKRDVLCEILTYIKKRVLNSDERVNAVLYFKQHLTKLITDTPDTSKGKKEKAKGRLPKGLKAPKLKTEPFIPKKTPNAKAKVPTTQTTETTESEETDDLTIHDTSSDDLDFSNSQISGQ